MEYEVWVQELLLSLRQGGYRGRIGMAGPQVPYASKRTLKNLYPGADYCSTVLCARVCRRRDRRPCVCTRAYTCKIALHSLGTLAYRGSRESRTRPLKLQRK